MTVGSAAVPVPATTTSETFQDINPAVTGLTYNGFTSAIGLAGSAVGSRDGSSIPGAGINNYFAQVTTSLGTASGQVWQALGNTPATFDSSIDTPLAGVLVTLNAMIRDGSDWKHAAGPAARAFDHGKPARQRAQPVKAGLAAAQRSP